MSTQGGVTANFTTSKAFLDRGLELLTFLKEDSEKLAAADLHELMRVWENVQRMWQAEAHMRSVALPRGDEVARVLFPVGFPRHGREELACLRQLPVGFENQYVGDDEETRAQFYYRKEIAGRR